MDCLQCDEPVTMDEHGNPAECEYCGIFFIPCLRWWAHSDHVWNCGEYLPQVTCLGIPKIPRARALKVAP